MVNIKIDKFKNKEYAYLRWTEFLVQVAEKKNAQYITKFNCYGNLNKAGEIYNNISSGATKRILMVGDLGQTVIDIENIK